MDDVVDQSSRYGPEGTAERGDDAGGHRALESQRIADGDDHLADAQRRGITQRSRDLCGGVDPQHRQIGVRIVADESGMQPAAVGKRDVGLGSAVRNVTIREYETVGCEDESRSMALLLAR